MRPIQEQKGWRLRLTNLKVNRRGLVDPLGLDEYELKTVVAFIRQVEHQARLSALEEALEEIKLWRPWFYSDKITKEDKENLLQTLTRQKIEELRKEK